MNRLELAGETVRAALEALAAAAPGWLAGVIDASWRQVTGSGSMTAAAATARQPRGTGGAVRPRRLPAAAAGARSGGAGLAGGAARGGALRRIWIQQFYLEAGEGGEKVIWRGDGQGLPTARYRLVSPYDLECGTQKSAAAAGPGTRCTCPETCHIPGAAVAPGSNLIASTETTLAPVTDVEMTELVHDTLDARGLLPGEHAVDTGYASAGCCWPRAPAASPCSPRCWPITPAGPLRRVHRRHVRHRLGEQAGHLPARCRLQLLGPGPRQARGPTPSWPGSPGRPAGPARPAPSAPPRPATAASSASAPARCTRPSPPPAPSRPAMPGSAGTGSAPEWRAPSPRPPTSPASAAPATSACPRPAWNTTPQPPPST